MLAKESEAVPIIAWSVLGLERWMFWTLELTVDSSLKGAANLCLPIGLMEITVCSVPFW